MPNFYEISPAHDDLTLHDGKGSASFSVRYVGNRRVEARATAVPMEGARDTWLDVEPPAQFELAPGQTELVKAAVAIPDDASPGRYGLRLDVVSVDNPDEEYVRGPSVTFQVEQPEKPEPKHQSQAQPQPVVIKHQLPRWALVWMIFVATLALIVMAFAFWWFFRLANDFPFDRFFGIAACGIEKQFARRAAGLRYRWQPFHRSRRKGPCRSA